MRRAEEKSNALSTNTNFTSSGGDDSSSDDINPYRKLPYKTEDNENVDRDIDSAKEQAARVEKRLKWIQGEAERIKAKKQIAQEAAQKRASSFMNSVEKIRTANTSFANKSKGSFARQKTKDSVIEFNNLDEISDIEDDEPDFPRFSDDDEEDYVK